LATFLVGLSLARAAWIDHRFKAVLNMDWGESLPEAIEPPYFFIGQSEPPSPEGVSSVSVAKRREMDFNWRQFMQLRLLVSKRGGYWLLLPGSRHTNFSDTPFASPQLFGLWSRRLDPIKAARVISTYMVAFFDKYLKGIPQPQLEGNTGDDPEVRFEHLIPAAKDERRPEDSEPPPI
jgi:hypothetical protein